MKTILHSMLSQPVVERVGYVNLNLNLNVRAAWL